MYPEYIEVNNKTYKINTDYKYALACFRALEDDDINDYARVYAIISILLGKENNENIEVPQFNNEELSKAIELLVKYLSCNKSNDKDISNKRDMDFIQDEEYIKASFYTDYQIDLDNTKMHWWKFCNMIEGFTEKCILNKVRDIRNTDLSEYKDQKTKDKLIRAMETVKLKNKKSREEKILEDEFNKLF